MKNLIKKMMDFNPLLLYRRKSLRDSVKQNNITFLTPDCIGGILFHDLGMKFMSPTVNLMMTQMDFLQFVLYLDDFLDGEFEFFIHPNYSCPCAKLYASSINKSIIVYFTHYNSSEEACNKWNERKKRIDKENIYIFIEERDGITKEDLKKLSCLNVKGIVAFTCNEYKDIPYAVYLPKYGKDGEVGNILRKNFFTGRREYEKYFDFVKWFNEADGAPYDVNSFCK